MAPTVGLHYRFSISLVLITMFCRLVRPKASSIPSDWTQPAF